MGQKKEMMTNTIIGIALLIAWFLIAVEPAAKKGYEDRDLPNEKKRGTSILPVFPVAPILVGLIVYAAHKYLASWVAVVLLCANATWALVALGRMAYWIVRMRMAQQTGGGSGIPLPHR